jgi:hypothetical protein
MKINELTEIFEALEASIQDFYVEFEQYRDPPYTVEDISKFVFGAASVSNKIQWAGARPFRDRYLVIDSGDWMDKDKKWHEVRKQSCNGNVAKQLTVTTKNAGRNSPQTYGIIQQIGSLNLHLSLLPEYYTFFNLPSRPFNNYTLSKILRERPEWVDIDDSIQIAGEYNTRRLDLYRILKNSLERTLFACIYFSADHGYTPVKFEVWTAGEVQYCAEITELQQISGGLWYPRSVRSFDTYSYSGCCGLPERDRNTPTDVLIYQVSKILVNQGLSQDNFDIKFPPGTEVNDMTQDIQYIVSSDEKTTQSDQEFQGWIHISSEISEEISHKNNAVHEEHINTLDETYIVVTKTAKNFQVQFYSPANDLYADYGIMKQQVAYYELGSYSTKQKVEDLPLTLKKILTQFRNQTQKDPYEVLHHREGPYDRVDVRFFKDEDEAKRICQEKKVCAPPMPVTFWIDANTHLVHKLAHEFNGKQRFVHITYGDPVIRDIYDLGVPQSADVIDHRKKSEVVELLRRLQINRTGWNHYTGLMTRTTLNQDGSYADHGCLLYWLAEKGSTWLSYLYGIGHGESWEQKIWNAAVKNPDCPLEMDIKSTLDTVRRARPIEWMIEDGHNLWSELSGVPLKAIGHIKNSRRPAARIWNEQFDHGPGTVIQKIVSDEKPNQVGLHIEFHRSRGITCKKRHEMFYWYDPQKQDMPMERISRSYAENDKTVEFDEHTRYLNYSQLPDGRWYPSRWQTTHYEKEITRAMTFEYRLTLSTDIEPEDSWFLPPS